MKKMIHFVIVGLLMSFTSSYAEGNLGDITTTSDFQTKVLQSTKPVFVKFAAKWCSACQKMRPIIDSIAGENSAKYDFFTVDVDAGSQLADQYNVTGLPTVMFFKNGNKVGQVVGEQSKKDLVASMQKFLG